jgi:hypothetical protein
MSMLESERDTARIRKALFLRSQRQMGAPFKTLTVEWGWRRAARVRRKTSRRRSGALGLRVVICEEGTRRGGGARRLHDVWGGDEVVLALGGEGGCE